MVCEDSLPLQLRANRPREAQKTEAFLVSRKLRELRIARVVGAYEQFLAVEDRRIDRCSEVSMAEGEPR